MMRLDRRTAYLSSEVARNVFECVNLRSGGITHANMQSWEPRGDQLITGLDSGLSSYLRMIEKRKQDSRSSNVFLSRTDLSDYAINYLLYVDNVIDYVMKMHWGWESMHPLLMDREIADQRDSLILGNNKVSHLFEKAEFGNKTKPLYLSDTYNDIGGISDTAANFGRSVVRFYLHYASAWSSSFSSLRTSTCVQVTISTLDINKAAGACVETGELSITSSIMRDFISFVTLLAMQDNYDQPHSVAHNMKLLDSINTHIDSYAENIPVDASLDVYKLLLA